MLKQEIGTVSLFKAAGTALLKFIFDKRVKGRVKKCAEHTANPANGTHRWSRERNQLRYYVVSVVVFSDSPIMKTEQLAKV